MNDLLLEDAAPNPAPLLSPKMASDFLRKYTGPSIALGRAITDARIKKGLSQARLGSLAGCTYSQIFRLERGESGTRLERLTVICEILGLDTATLLELARVEQDTLPEELRTMRPKKKTQTPERNPRTFISGSANDLAWMLLQLSFDVRELEDKQLELMRMIIETAKQQIDYFRQERPTNGS